jgi:hypothetical protein
MFLKLFLLQKIFCERDKFEINNEKKKFLHREDARSKRKLFFFKVSIKFAKLSRLVLCFILLHVIYSPIAVAREKFPFPFESFIARLACKVFSLKAPLRIANESLALRSCLKLNLHFRHLQIFIFSCMRKDFFPSFSREENFFFPLCSLFSSLFRNENF